VSAVAATREGRGTKLEQARGALAKWEARAAELDSKLAESQLEEEQARAEALRVAPTQRPGGVGTPVDEIVKRRAKMEKELAGLRADLPHARAAVAEFEAEERERLFAEHRKEARRRAEAVKETLTVAGVKFEALFEAYLAFVEASEQMNAWAVEVAAGLTDEETRTRWLHEEARLPLQPVPVDLLAFLDVLVKASCDPHGDGYRETDGEGKRTDDDRVLPTLVPDLRGRNRVAVIEGQHVSKRASGTWFAHGYRPHPSGDSTGWGSGRVQLSGGE